MILIRSPGTLPTAAPKSVRPCMVGKAERGCTGIMEKNMETIIMGLYWDNGQENGHYYNGVLLGLGFRGARAPIGLQAG